MMRLRHKLLIHAFRVFDQALLVFALAVWIALIPEHGSFAYIREVLNEMYGWREILGLLFLVLGWVVIFSSIIHYDANRFTTLMSSVWALIKATTGSAFLLFVIGEGLGISKLPGRVILLFWASTTLVGIVSRIVLRWILTAVRKSGFNCRNVIFVGTDAYAVDLARNIESHPELGCRVVGFVAEDKKAVGAPVAPGAHWPVVASIEHIQAFLEHKSVDEIIICLPIQECFGQIYRVFELCRDLGVVVRLIPREADLKVLTRLQIESFGDFSVITFFREKLLLQLLLKRIMDVVVSMIALAVLSPLMLVIALIIKFNSPGPVFFVQERIGMNRRKFKLLKFRSMVADAEKRKKDLAALNEMDGPVFKVKNDPRVTPIGRFIRKTSIDELPQLINVLKGEMSLVGPRPPLPSEVDQYEWLHRRRLSIKPGITCLWQVNGRNSVPFVQWMEMDKEYVENWSIWLDIKILCRTLPVVLFGYGAS
ncbi:MAG TPA: sugar transferase [Verrucomicrobiae bacterium]|jgi:exopolysaccharide biosynthesis polyprenyl glycosylphosphotransferase|nr:sugar transferase [Verrucomicrobiae bacterium]